MTGKTLGLATVGGVAVGSAVAAGLAVWLVVAEPTRVALAVANHDPMPLLEALSGILGQLLSALVRYL